MNSLTTLIDKIDNKTLKNVYKELIEIDSLKSAELKKCSELTKKLLYQENTLNEKADFWYQYFILYKEIEKEIIKRFIDGKIK